MNFIQQFLAATTSSAFVIFLEFDYSERHLRVGEFTFENAATKEELTVRDAIFKNPLNGADVHYVELLRHPIGADAIMREWIAKRAYYEKQYSSHVDENNKEIWIYAPTIG